MAATLDPRTDPEHIARAYRGILAAFLSGDMTIAEAVKLDAGHVKRNPWLLPGTEGLDPTWLVTTAEAADIARRPTGTIRRWACTRHPLGTRELLLPPKGSRGLSRLYLAVHVDEVARLASSGWLRRIA